MQECSAGGEFRRGGVAQREAQAFRLLTKQNISVFRGILSRINVKCFFQKDVLQRHREMSLFSWIFTMNTKVRRSSGWRSNLVGPKLSRSGDAPQERLSCVRLVSGAMHERRCKPVVQLANCQSSCTPDKSSQRLTRCLVAVRVCGADADISKASQFVHCDFCVLPYQRWHLIDPRASSRLRALPSSTCELHERSVLMTCSRTQRAERTARGLIAFPKRQSVHSADITNAKQTACHDASGDKSA